MKRRNTKTLLVLMVLALASVFWAFDLDQYLSLNALKLNRASLLLYHRRHPVFLACFYGLTYIAVTALSLPGATVLTLAGGAVFGFIEGTVLVSFASTIGATLAFLLSRFLFQDWVQSRFADRLEAVNNGIKQEGAYYLLALRLVPAFPFFVINLVMGLTPIKTRTYFIVSQAGMLPGTMAYIYAGRELGGITSLSGIVSPGILTAFVILGILPIILKRLVQALRQRKMVSKYKKPRHFDYNVVVIGAGSGGLVSAYIAAAVKAKVALIERHKMGGDCLNTGCVPSKALIRSAKILSYTRRANDFGLRSATVDYDFSEVMERVQRVIKKVEPHDSVERYQSLGVECITGEAGIVSPWKVSVGEHVLTTRNIIIATGASPFVPPIKNLESIEYYTSDTIWKLRDRPNNLLVLGGGPIGCELSQAFSRLGCSVTTVESGSQLLRREDPEVSKVVMDKFKAEGIKLFLNHRAKEIKTNGDQKLLVCQFSGGEREIPFDQILIALGRRATVKGFGLEELGVELTESGMIETDPFLRTNFPNIYACGDVAGPYQFTHTASHQAWYASVNALFSPYKKFKVDYRVIPWCTFTDPEVAQVGINEKTAQQKGVKYEVTRYEIDDLDRAIADGEDHGFVKVLTEPGKDRILGVTIVGTHAGDLIAEYILAMKHGLGLNKILQTIHIYPTLAESNKFAAGIWKREHAPENLLRWVEKFHRWRRKN